MALRDKIFWIYPKMTQEEFFLTVVIVASEEGEVLSEWLNTEYPRPTEEQLAAAPDTPFEFVPEFVPMWAVRTILEQDGLLEQVEGLIGASTDAALKNVWNFGNYAYRKSAMIETLATALGLSDSKVDEMFIAAGKLEV